jgi:feruloyl esterase
MNFTTQNTFYHGWNARTNTGADGKPILTADKLLILHRAVVAKCDEEDGLKDGLVSKPLSCHFDPAVVECKPGQEPASCLTSAQVKVAREIYAGAHDSAGNKMVLSGPLLGSELAWEGVYIPRAGEDRTMSGMISAGTLKYLAYDRNPPASYTLQDLKFDTASFESTTKLHGLYDATDPDLSPFAAAGGKLILWHGLADPHISPLNTVAYYTAMQKLLGKDAVDKFARLYLFPGGYHCGGGEGPFSVDLMSAIMAWVERGDAPNALIASHSVGGEGNGPPSGVPPGGRPPLGPGGLPPNMAGGPPPGMPQGGPGGPAKADRTRPVFPYPLTAQYTGSGSIDDARNFVAGTPHPVPAGLLIWLGSAFYSPHYELWCTGNGAAMSCRPNR